MPRLPKPIALHIARGNPSQLTKAEIAAEPVPESDLTVDNHHLSRLTPNQRLLFCELVRLMPRGVLKETDVAACMFMAIHWDTAIEAAERFRPETLVVKTRDNTYRTNPYVGVFRRAAADCMAVAEQIGASPIARARLRGLGSIARSLDDGDDSPWAEFAGRVHQGRDK